jgi:predicted ATPase
MDLLERASLLDELDQWGRPRVVVVVVEDAHWADEATLDRDD